MSSPLLWGPGLSANLQDGIQLNGKSSVQSGTVNPSIVATIGETGSLFLNSSTGIIYVKNDSGVTTNWTVFSQTQSRVSAQYYQSGSSVAITANTPINFDTVIVDNTSAVTTGAGWKFTAPNTSDYILCFGAVSSSATPTFYVWKNGTSGVGFISGGAAGLTQTGSIIISLNAGDYIQMQADNATTLTGGFLTGGPLTFITIEQIANVAISGSSGITRSVSNISSPTTLGSTASVDYVALVSGTTTVTLPTAVSNTNRYTVTNTGTNTVTVATTSAQTINGSSTATLPIANMSLDFISDGANWHVE